MKNFHQLSRAELKNVIGGSQPVCVYTLAPGAENFVPPPCVGSPSACQADADDACYASDDCISVDCR